MAGSVGSDDGDAGFQIAPMVDVVFVLMLFFMASAGSQLVEKELKIKLPAGPTTDVGKETPIVIEIDPSGMVSMNSQPYGKPDDKSLTALTAWLAKTIETIGDKDPVIIRPSMDARHDRIVDVLNAASKARVKNLTFG